MIFKTTKKLMEQNDELTNQNYRLIRENERLQDRIRVLELVRQTFEDKTQIEATIPKKDFTKGEINHFLFEILKSKVIEEISDNFTHYVTLKPMIYNACDDCFTQYCFINVERNKCK